VNNGSLVNLLGPIVTIVIHDLQVIFVLLVKYWLVNDCGMVFLDDWLMVFVDDLLVMLVDIDLLVDHILVLVLVVVFVDEGLLYNRLADVVLHDIWI